MAVDKVNRPIRPDSDGQPSATGTLHFTHFTQTLRAVEEKPTCTGIPNYYSNRVTNFDCRCSKINAHSSCVFCLNYLLIL